MNNINILLLAIVLILCIAYYGLYCDIEKLKETEHYTQISNDALQTLSSVYNNGTLTVTNLNVTGDAQIGKWTVKGNAIGMPGIADINLGSDGWVRLLKYGSTDINAYSGSGGTGGFAAYNLWAANSDSKLYGTIINGKTINNTGDINNSGNITTTNMTASGNVTTVNMTASGSVGNIKNAGNSLYPNAMVFNSYVKGGNTPGALCLNAGKDKDGKDMIRCLSVTDRGFNNCGSMTTAAFTDVTRTC